MKTYEEMAQQISDISDAMYLLSKDLEAHYKENMKPGEKPMNICYLAKEALRNMAYSLESLADVMLGN